MLKMTLDDQFASIPWDALDAIVFDVGNVLVTFSPEKILQEFFPDDAALRALLLDRIFRSPYWIMLDRGSITLEEAVRAMTGSRPELEPAIRRVIESRLDLKEPIPEGVAALRLCKKMGKKVIVLSNYQDEAFEQVCRKYDFFQLFDGFVVSARLKLLKPCPAIYRKLTDTFGLEPARTLFIDDTPANVEGAMNEGWQGLCFNKPGKLSSFIV